MNVGSSQVGGILTRSAVALVACVAAASCAARPAPPTVDAAFVGAGSAPSVAVLSAESERRLVFVTIDGVRWQELAFGLDPTLAPRAGFDPAALGDGAALAPNLARLAGAGFVSGLAPASPMVASGPAFVSLPGYTEMYTGRVATCAGNGCAGALEPTWLDAARDAFGAREVALVASWERLCQGATFERRIAASCGRAEATLDAELGADPAVRAALDAGRRAPAGLGEPSYRPDVHTADLAVAVLRAAKPRVLAVGLGDTDEHAHVGDYAGYVAALRHADEAVGRLVAAARELPGETFVVVTTDHGREAAFQNHGAFAPESSRVFALGAALRGPGVDAAPRPTRLADLAPLAMAWLRVPVRTAWAFAPFGSVTPG